MSVLTNVTVSLTSAMVIAYLDAWIVPIEEQRAQFDHSYPTWGKHATLWDTLPLRLGGSYQLKAIRWFQHVKRPGSTVSRPDIVLNAIYEAINH